MELAALKQAAEAATPGPWATNTAGATKDGVFTYDEVYVYSPANRKVAIAADVADPLTGEPSPANAAYIALANPQAVMELIAAYEQAIAVLVFYAKPGHWDEFRDDARAEAFDRNTGSALGDDGGAMARASVAVAKSERAA